MSCLFLFSGISQARSLIEDFNLTKFQETDLAEYYYDQGSVGTFNPIIYRNIEFIANSLKEEYPELHINKNKGKLKIIYSKRYSKMNMVYHNGLLASYNELYHQIVLTDEVEFSTVVHEYIHSISVRETVLPNWANEGLSLFFEKSYFDSQHIHLGVINNGRVVSMMNRKTFFNDNGSFVIPYYDKIKALNYEPLKAGSSYTESQYASRYGGYLVVAYLYEKGVLRDVLNRISRSEAKQPFGWHIKKSLGLTEEELSIDFNLFANDFFKFFMLEAKSGKYEFPISRIFEDITFHDRKVTGHQQFCDYTKRTINLKSEKLCN